MILADIVPFTIVHRIEAPATFDTWLLVYDFKQRRTEVMDCSYVVEVFTGSV